MAERLRNDTHAQLLYSLGDVRLRINGVLFILLGLFVMLIPQSIIPDSIVRLLFLLFGALLIFGGISVLNVAAARYSILLNSVEQIPFEKPQSATFERLS
jgi:hypothetical protein